jgi:hypothetical protein
MSGAPPPMAAASLAFPAVPTAKVEPPPMAESFVFPQAPVGFGESSFMLEVKSLIARFQRANKPNQAFLFFKGFCAEAYKEAGLGEVFGAKLYWLAGERLRWQTFMTGIPVKMKEKVDADPANTYYWIKSSMEIFEDKVINSVKTKFADQSFPNKFFTDLLRSYQVVNGKVLMVGVGRKRRKTRKARKTKRHTKLRIKRRLIAS